MKIPTSKLFGCLVLAACSVSFIRAGTPTVNELLGQAQTIIEKAGHHGEGKELEQAKIAIDKALVLEPKSVWAWYYKGYAAYTDFVLMTGKKDNLAKEAALNEADQALQKSIELEPSGEALALHSSVLGGLIGVRGAASAEQLIPRIGDALSRARKQSPENPRVLFIAGVSVLFTPPEWGGDVNEAIKLLEKAKAAFEQDHPPAPQPSWGRAGTHVWLGLAYQKIGDNAKAKTELEKALAIDPEYNWVKNALLPALEKSK